MLFDAEDLQGKISKVYNKKKNKNYKNIEVFSTLDYNTNVRFPILEGLTADYEFEDYETYNDEDDFGDGSQDKNKDKWKSGKEIIDAYEFTINKYLTETNGNGNGNITGKSVGERDEARQLFEIAEREYAKVKEKKQALIDDATGVGDTITDTDKIKELGKDMFNKRDGDVKPPSEFEKAVLIINTILSFVLNFINNTLAYISIVLVQFIYKDKPILPFRKDMFGKDKVFMVKNWPWKLDLDVSPKDNKVLDKKAKLYNPKNGPIPLADGGYISGEQYRENQKILYDANIVFNLFTQIILVALTWVFTNNAYYYLYKDPSTDINSSDFPFRVISPYNEMDGVNVKRGFNIFPFAIINTLVTSPYDMLFLFFYSIKVITQFIGLYEFRSLMYIILFLFILWFSLTQFWEIYAKFMDKPFAFIFNPFFAIFIIYGIYQHFFKVTIVDEENKPVNFIFKHTCSFIIIFLVLLGLYPFIRIFFYFWIIYVFFGLQGFGNDTYNDIVKFEKKKTCDSNKVSILKIMREIINYFFEYFFYFVVFVLVISNFTYLNTIPTYSSKSSSGMKILVSIIFLLVFMYLVYSLLNKNSPRTSKVVIYGKSYVNEPPPDIDGIVGKIDMPKFDSKPKPEATVPVPPVPVPTDATVPPVPGPTDATVPVSDATVLSTTDATPSEATVSTNYLPELRSKVKALLLLIDGEQKNPTLTTIIPGSNLHLQAFLNTLTQIETILDDPILIELLHTPFYISKLKDKIKMRIDTDTSIPPNIKAYLDRGLIFINELIKEKIDVKLSNFINDLMKTPISIKDKGDEYVKNIKEKFAKEITELKSTIAIVLKRVFPKEIGNAINITQIYNTPGLQALFIQGEPEIGICTMIISDLYPSETKPSLTNSVQSAFGIAKNAFV